MTQTPVKFTATHPQTSWSGSKILESLIAIMPEALTQTQAQALADLQAGDFLKCKIYPCIALNDSLVKAIAYMSSIPGVADKNMPQLATLVAESCRAIADACREAVFTTSGGDEKSATAAHRQAVESLESVCLQIFDKGLTN